MAPTQQSVVDQIIRLGGNAEISDIKAIVERETDRILTPAPTGPYPDPVVMKIPARMLISAQTQRDLRPGWSKAIADNFDPELLREFTISYRDDVFYILDGQHRHDAVMRRDMGDEEMTCLVYSGLTPYQESMLYKAGTKALKPSAQDKWKINKQTYEPQTMQIIALLRKHNIGEGYISPGILESLAKKRGLAHLDDVLTLRDEVWGYPVTKESMGSNMLEAFSFIIMAYTYERGWGVMRRDRMAKQIALNLGKLDSDRGRSKTSSQTMARANSMVMVSYYNQKLRTTLQLNALPFTNGTHL